MRAKFSAEILSSRDNAEMASIMRSCVHCGFCNATCPTYQLRGDELDGPRGRIYLIKSMLEEGALSDSTQTHLDRCLTCRACETTCPSGVNYSRLVELARPMVDEKVKRKPWDKLKRWLIRQIVPYPRRFAAAMFLPQLVKPALPRLLSELVPAREILAPVLEQSEHSRKMILLDGCVQQVAGANINAAAKDVFDGLEVQLESNPSSGCCGAVSYHLGEVDEARRFARQNIDAWTKSLAAGAEAVIATSSGCAVMLKEYAELLRDDPIYATRAAQVTALVRDPSEVLDVAALGQAYQVTSNPRIAFHAPCTQQHGLHASARAEACLKAVGFELTNVPEGHLCCGSAGSYSMLQPKLSGELLDRKISALQSDGPSVIASANIGCLLHLRRRAEPSVYHWLELIRPHKIAADVHS
jgi:glycolate oxidase iron-sulfur subunit